MSTAGALRVLIAFAVLCACAPKDRGRQHGENLVDPGRLTAFVDSFMTAEMARERIPGASFVFVQNGEVAVTRAYGLADVEAQRPVVAESAIWRIGSISKVFTATAVMQLVDRGQVDLDVPVDRYVHQVAIPATYPEPVTVRHLLDHTAGFDEIRPGTQAATADGVLPLDEFLRERLVRVRPPGKTIAYSTYGITLAGLLVEEVSGMPYEEYLRRNIFEPLGMTHSSITVPDGLQKDVVRGYELDGDSLVAQAWEWYHTTPASAINTTVGDMARFMLAHLGDGAIGSARILSADAAGEMHRQQVTMDPAMPGFAIGFYEEDIGGLRVLEHGGNMAGFSTLMVLIPEMDAGFYVVNHFEPSGLRDNLKWALMERFFPKARERRTVPPPPPVEQVHVERFVGHYTPLASCFSCDPVRLAGDIAVTANSDGTLNFAGNRWIAVDSLRFVSAKGTGMIAFRTGRNGEIEYLSAGSFFSWKRFPALDESE